MAVKNDGELYQELGMRIYISMLSEYKNQGDLMQEELERIAGFALFAAWAFGNKYNEND